MTEKRVTMEDIASEMNIAKSTVSIAIADKYGVSEEMRSKIILKAIEMGYDFSQVKIKHSKRKKIALVIEDNSSFHSGFWMSIIKGIEQRLCSLRYQFKIIVANQYESFDDIFIEASSSKIAGVIVLAGESFLKELILGFKRLKIELVLIDSLNYFSPQCNEVRAGNYAGGIECAEYLCKKGHKNFAFLRYDTFSYSMRQRCAGFEYGLDFFGKYQPVTFSCAEEVPALDDSIEQFLNTLQYPCAVFCANDFLASYLYYHAEQRGLKIPGDLSVVGFDNSSGELMDKITTFDIPKELLGARAVDLLIDRINEPDKPVEIIEIAVKMVERESVMDFTAKGNKS